MGDREKVVSVEVHKGCSAEIAEENYSLALTTSAGTVARPKQLLATRTHSPPLPPQPSVPSL